MSGKNEASQLESLRDSFKHFLSSTKESEEFIKALYEFSQQLTHEMSRQPFAATTYLRFSQENPIILTCSLFLLHPYFSCIQLNELLTKNDFTSQAASPINLLQCILKASEPMVNQIFEILFYVFPELLNSECLLNIARRHHFNNRHNVLSLRARIANSTLPLPPTTVKESLLIKFDEELQVQDAKQLELLILSFNKFLQNPTLNERDSEDIELAKALTIFSNMLQMETSLVKNQFDPSITLAPTPAIQMAKSNLLLLTYALFQLNPGFVGCSMLREYLSEHDYTAENQSPAKLLKLIFTHAIFSVEFDKVKILFFIYPELLNPEHLLEVLLHHDIRNRGIVKMLHQAITDSEIPLPPTINKPKLLQGIEHALQVDPCGRVRILSAMEQGDYQSFLTAFQFCCQNPINPHSKKPHENKLLQAREEVFSALNFVSEQLREPEQKCLQLVRDNPLLLLHVALPTNKYSLGINWANGLENSISNPKVLLGMLDDFYLFFKVYPELQSDVFLLSEEVVEYCRKPRTLYTHFSDITQKKLTEPMKRLVIRSALKNLDAATHAPFFNYDTLHFFFEEELSLDCANDAINKWYHFLPWDKLRAHHAYLFDHITPSPELIEYLNGHYPNLVHDHLLKGNFFIAKLLIERMSLASPRVHVADFLAQAIRVGLENTRELKKYQALVLLQVKAKVVNPEAMGLLATSKVVACSPLVLDKLLQQIPRLVEYYLTLSNDVNTLQSLNKVMFAIEKDYAIALSTLYNLPIIANTSSKTVKAYRGLKMLKSSTNEELMRFYFKFGHRAGFYDFLGHGYNRDVYERVCSGPRMAWDCQSDTTCVSPALEVSLRFSTWHENSDSYLMTIKSDATNPLYVGNWTTIGYERYGNIPYQFEMPHIAPESIESIVKLDRDNKVDQELYPEEFAIAFPCFVTDDVCEKTRRSNQVVRFASENLATLLKEYQVQVNSSYPDFVNSYLQTKVLFRFSNNCWEHSTVGLNTKHGGLNSKSLGFSPGWKVLKTQDSIPSDYVKWQKDYQEQYPTRSRHGCGPGAIIPFKQ